MQNLPDKLSIDGINGVVFIRVVGTLSESIKVQRHDLMLRDIEATVVKNVLFDVRSAQPQDDEARDLQQSLNAQYSALGLKLAVVVSSTRMAYLARQTYFGL